MRFWDWPDIRRWKKGRLIEIGRQSGEKNPKIGDKGYYLGLPSSRPNVCPGLKRFGVGRE